jgi:hypothetical protein
MTTLLGSIARRRIALWSLIALGACRSPTAVETLTVPIASGDTYRHATVGGDEEGAIIITQAHHYAISEMRRDSTTHWVATYIYQPAAGFTGRDMVEIEISSGSDGASPPTKVQRLRIAFDVH